MEICPVNDEAISEPFLRGTKLLMDRDEGAILTRSVTLQRPEANGLSENGRERCISLNESIHSEDCN